RTILDALPRRDRRVEFIHASLRELDGELKTMGGGLIVLHDHAEAAIPRLAAELDVEAVFVNRDYEPQAVRRDRAVATALETDGRTFHAFKDQVIFECDEILTKNGTPFSVFTPYKNAWLRQLHAGGDMALLQAFDIDAQRSRLAAPPPGMRKMPSLAEIGFEKTDLEELGIPIGMSGAQALFDDFAERMREYGRRRDFPASKGPSYLSVHLRFG